MIILTLLIYVHAGQEDVFDEFEAHAIPIISKYNGELMLRTRPGTNATIESTIEVPYEIHLISFNSESDFQAFLKDEERKQFLHLKEQSIQTTMLIKGEML